MNFIQILGFIRLGVKVVASQLDPKSPSGIILNKIIDLTSLATTMSGLPSGANAMHAPLPPHQLQALADIPHAALVDEVALKAWAEQQSQAQSQAQP